MRASSSSQFGLRMAPVPVVTLFTEGKSANISTKSLWRGLLHNVKNHPTEEEVYDIFRDICISSNDTAI